MAADTYTVKGAGADVWGTADAFDYVYRPMTGDGWIVARVASVQNTSSWSKAGVMIRESLDAGAAHAYMLVSFSKGLAFQRRAVAGGDSSEHVRPGGGRTLLGEARTDRQHGQRLSSQRTASRGRSSAATRLRWDRR